LQEFGRLDVIQVQRVEVFYVVFNCIEVRKRCNFVRYNNEAIMIRVDKIDDNIRFNALESTVQINNMFAKGDYELFYIITAYGNNDLFVQIVRNRLATEPVMLKVYNVKLCCSNHSPEQHL